MEQQPPDKPALATKLGLRVIVLWAVLGMAYVGFAIWSAFEGDGWILKLALGIVWLCLALGWAVARRRAIQVHEES
ncbi:hypothetical protein [Arthrobacter sp. H20]|uniref:hypothetical protein n=1 Tax=Arthrobacter sp. H20 TaxID=1267981 RepID=UPI00047E14ED|nr:hypothetical protein [Arthrobacter sp. H20]